MIFVTTGSQKFQFNRLLRAVDNGIASGAIDDEVFAQTGYSDYRPMNYSGVAFLDKQQFDEKMDACDILITHAGTGAIIGALKKGKKVIAMPRLRQFGEHVDDHQVQLLEQFAEAGLILCCSDEAGLIDAYRRAKTREAVVFRSNNAIFLEDLDNYLSVHLS